MKKIKTNKDMIFCIIALLWLISNVVSALIINDCFFVNNFFIIIMCILILIKNNSSKFRKFLNKQFNFNQNG